MYPGAFWLKGCKNCVGYNKESCVKGQVHPNMKLSPSTCLSPQWSLQTTQRRSSLPARRHSARPHGRSKIAQWHVTNLVPGTKNASCGAVFHHRNEDKDAFLRSLPEKVCVGCMASNDASGERRTQPYRFEQEFDDGEAVRTGRRWRRRWSPRRLLGEAWEPISAGAEAEPDESRWEHCRWCKCDCRVRMTKIKEHPCCPEAIPLLRRRGGHRLAVPGCTMCWSVCAWTCLRCGIDKIFWEPVRPGIAVKAGMYLSGDWRMFWRLFSGR